MNTNPTLFTKDLISHYCSDFLETLNPAQREAVEQVYGTVLVLAGPGTGKTHMLTARIANILQKTDADARNILCLTFTENGATQMRRRLASWIGPEAYKVKISTFHGFCESVMQQYPERFMDLKGDRELADDLEKALVFKKIIESKNWNHFRPFGDNFYWHGAFRSTVGHLKRENVSVEKLIN